MIDTSIFQGKKAAYFTLGCKLNFSETSTFGRMLQELGVQTVRNGETADICLINTCSVTEVADHKCRQTIHRMVRQHPDAFVVVTGCYSQLSPDVVSKIEGVDLVLGSDEKARLVSFLSEALMRKEMNQTGTSTACFTQKTKGYKKFCTLLFTWQSHTVFPESTGWLRLFLYILYHTFCARLQPESSYCIIG